MLALTWLRGLIAHRRTRLISAAVGVAVTVALLASIGSFLASISQKMTTRAVARVPVDWQVEAKPGAGANLLAQVRHDPQVRRALPVGFADTTGLQSRAGGSVQQTGPGKVLGLPDGYAKAFPGELRTLAGSGSGVLLAQQTAANLHARPGDRVSIGRAGASPVTVKVDGVVDLPAADSLFQRVGAPVGRSRRRRPTTSSCSRSVSSRRSRASRPGPKCTRSLRTRFPAARAPPTTRSTGTSVETRLAGAGVVGDNLGTASRRRSSWRNASATAPLCSAPSIGARCPATRTPTSRSTSSSARSTTACS
jgi:putative ABC transport system permease protein